MQDVKLFIFDLDGTLIDSMYVWDQVSINFFKNNNLKLTQEYLNLISNMSFQESAEYTIKQYNLNKTIQDVINDWNNLALFEYTNNVKLKENALKYLKYLKSQNIKLAIATSLTKLLAEAVLTSNNLLNIFDYILTTEEVGKDKDYPDILLEILKHFNINNNECIAVEDSLKSIKTLKELNIKTYGIYDKSSHNHKEEIQKLVDKYIFNYDSLLNFN